jgi:hypothetical protein
VFFFYYILTLQDKHNTKIQFICTHCKTCQKTLLFYPFLKLTQMNLIFSDNIHIVYYFCKKFSWSKSCKEVNSDYNSFYVELNDLCFLIISAVSKAHTNESNIFRQYTYCICISTCMQFFNQYLKKQSFNYLCFLIISADGKLIKCRCEVVSDLCYLLGNYFDYCEIIKKT